jgi:hypothetical protein
VDLKKIFRFGSWRVGSGKFLGMHVHQDSDFSITCGNPEYHTKLRPLRVPGNLADSEAIPASMISQFRGALGTLQWMAGHWRPDLAAQASLALQGLPHPSLRDVKRCNDAIRRARQDPNMAVIFRPVPFSRMLLTGHTDASLGNARRGGTQAGMVIGIGEAKIRNGTEGIWGVLAWRSSRLKRVVGSTLAAETQQALNTARELAWTATLLSEISHGHIDLEVRGQVVQETVPTTLVVDCKSLYDLLVAPTVATGSGRDREASVDVIMLRQVVEEIGAEVRWVPAARQLGDSMTKDSAEAVDSLKGAITEGRYAIGLESRALEIRAAAKTARLERGRTRREANGAAARPLEETSQ